MSGQQLSQALQLVPGNTNTSATGIIGFGQSLDVAGSQNAMLNVATSASTTLATGLISTNEKNPVPSTPPGGVIRHINLIERDSNTVFAWEANSELSYAVASRAYPDRPVNAVGFGINRVLADENGDVVLNGATFVEANVSRIASLAPARVTVNGSFEIPGYATNIHGSGPLAALPALELRGNTILDTHRITQRHAMGSTPPLAHHFVVPIDEANAILSELVVNACAGTIAVHTRTPHVVSGFASVDAADMTVALRKANEADMPMYMDAFFSGHGISHATLYMPTTHTTTSGVAVERSAMHALRRDWQRVHPGWYWDGPVSTKAPGESTWLTLDGAAHLTLPLSEVPVEYVLQPAAGSASCAHVLDLDANFTAIGPRGVSTSIVSPGVIEAHMPYANSTLMLGEDLASVASVYELVRRVGPYGSATHVVQTYNVAAMLLALNPYLTRLRAWPPRQADVQKARVTMPAVLDFAMPNAYEHTSFEADFAHERLVHVAGNVDSPVQIASATLSNVTASDAYYVYLGDAHGKVEPVNGIVRVSADGYDAVANIGFAFNKANVVLSVQPGRTRFSVLTPTGDEVSVSVPSHVPLRVGERWGSVTSSAPVSVERAYYRGMPRETAFVHDFAMETGEVNSIALPADFAIETAAHVATLTVNTGSGVIMVTDVDVITSVTVDAPVTWIVSRHSIDVSCSGGSANVSLKVVPTRGVAIIPGLRDAVSSNVQLRMPAFVQVPTSDATPPHDVMPVVDVRAWGTLYIGEHFKQANVRVFARSGAETLTLVQQGAMPGEVVDFTCSVQQLVDAGLIEAVNTEFVPISLLYTFDDGIEHTLGNVGVRTTYADPAQLHLEQANASNYAMRVLDTAGAGYLHALKDTRFSMSIV